MDIDLDFADSAHVKTVFKDKITLASRVENNELRQHPVGVYFQNIPRDTETGFAAIPCIISGEEPRRDRAQELGYFKIDLLHVDLLKHFKSKEEIRKLLKIEPDWSMLEDETIVKQLFHIRNQFDVVFQVKPKSIDDLSDVLALIRPGKIKLLDKYLKNRDAIRLELYTKRQGSDLRKSHTIPYAMLIMLHMHILKRELP